MFKLKRGVEGETRKETDEAYVAKSWKLLSMNWWIHGSPLFSILHTCLETFTIKTQTNKAGYRTGCRGWTVEFVMTSQLILQKIWVQFQDPHVRSQLSVTPDLGYPMPTSSLSGHYKQVVHRNKGRENTHTHTNKFFKRMFFRAWYLWKLYFSHIV